MRQHPTALPRLRSGRTGHRTLVRTDRVERTSAKLDHLFFYYAERAVTVAKISHAVVQIIAAALTIVYTGRETAYTRLRLYRGAPFAVTTLVTFLL